MHNGWNLGGPPRGPKEAEPAFCPHQTRAIQRGPEPVLSGGLLADPVPHPLPGTPGRCPRKQLNGAEEVADVCPISNREGGVFKGSFKERDSLSGESVLE